MVKVIVYDRYCECEFEYWNIVHINEGSTTFKIVKEDGFYKEFNKNRFDYKVEK